MKKIIRNASLMMLVAFFSTGFAACGGESLEVSTEAQSDIDNRHPFAIVLSEFFVNLAPQPYFEPSDFSLDWTPWLYPYSSHAILVDLDGNGTQGMLAAKLSDDWRRYAPFAMYPDPIFVHRLFMLYGDEVITVYFHQWPDQAAAGRTAYFFHMAGVTPAGRLVLMPSAAICGFASWAYTLLELSGGYLTPVKSISVDETSPWDGYRYVHDPGLNEYRLSYHTEDFWQRDREQDIPLTYEEFHELLILYGLHGTTFNVWELPDETDAILLMFAD